MNDITTVKLFENSVVLIDGDSQTIKHEVKNDFLVYIKNFTCFIIRKTIDWERCNESSKKI